MKSITEDYKGFLSEIDYSHMVTIEPLPDKRMTLDNVKQSLREVEFKLNKFFLKRTWSKWKMLDRFFFIGFYEGKGLMSHHHLLLYSPKIYNHQSNSVKNFLYNHWTDRQPINVTEIYDSVGMTRYSSKEMTLHNDNFYFTH